MAVTRGQPVGSVSVSRVDDVEPVGGSSTTPKPNGTGPS